MLDFSPAFRGETTLGALTASLTVEDLRAMTNQQIERQLELIADCVDTDVAFVPVDPDANDDAASDPAEANIAWTLGHVIAHVTAGGEETAALAAELARGVEFHGRSRYEVPWETIKTVAQCRHRLEESRRMRLASLGMWPDQPDLSTTNEPWPGAGPMNALAYFSLGIAHEQGHLAQIEEIVRQAKAARAS